MTQTDWQALVDTDRLCAWMDREGLESGPILDARPLAGGSQNLLLHLRRGAREFVLRRPPANPLMNGSETMRREARVLRALAASDVPHPRLIAACATEDVLGVAFCLLEHVEGFTATSGLPPLHAGDPALRRRMGFAFVDGIAALAAVDHVAAGLADFGRTDAFLERQVARWWRQLEGYAAFAGWEGPGALPQLENTAKWLEDNRPRSFTPGIMHGDYHLANVMFRLDGPELAAIVDWELATIGDPLIDLGWVLAGWPDDDGAGSPLGMRIEPWNGFPTGRELVARYAERSTRDLGAIGWYTVFACYKLGILLEGTHARACAGLAPRATGEALHAGAIGLLARAADLQRSA